MNKFALLQALIPAILQTAVAVEKTVTGPKKGKSKLEIVANTTLVAAQAIPEVRKNFSRGDLDAVIRNITNATVEGLNAAEVFKKTTEDPKFKKRA